MAERVPKTRVSGIYLPFLCTFHFLQKSEKETEFFAKKAKNAKDFLRLFFEYIGGMQMLSTRYLPKIRIFIFKNNVNPLMVMTNAIEFYG